MYDLIILGSGPAGLAASIYAARARLSAITIEREMMSGGQVLTTTQVDNYPGLPGIGGFDLAVQLREHAESLGAVFVEDEIVEISLAGEVKRLTGREGVYEARCVILATGAGHRLLGVPGEERLAGRGVGYCAVCDGAFYKKLVTVVVGGGDVAAEDALFLARICRRVYLVHRRDELRAAAYLQEQVAAEKNIEPVWNHVVEEICGEEQVKAVVLRDVNTGRTRRLEAAGVFIAIGIRANSELFAGELAHENGHLLAGEDGACSLPGVYAAGDVRKKPLYQIVTAVADGANAVAAAEKYLRT